MKHIRNSSLASMSLLFQILSGSNLNQDLDSTTFYCDEMSAYQVKFSLTAMQHYHYRRIWGKKAPLKLKKHVF